MWVEKHPAAETARLRVLLRGPRCSKPRERAPRVRRREPGAREHRREKRGRRAHVIGADRHDENETAGGSHRDLDAMRKTLVLCYERPQPDPNQRGGEQADELPERRPRRRGVGDRGVGFDVTLIGVELVKGIVHSGCRDGDVKGCGVRAPLISLSCERARSMSSCDTGALVRITLRLLVAGR